MNCWMENKQVYKFADKFNTINNLYGRMLSLKLSLEYTTKHLVCSTTSSRLIIWLGSLIIIRVRCRYIGWNRGSLCGRRVSRYGWGWIRSWSGVYIRCRCWCGFIVVSEQTFLLMFFFLFWNLNNLILTLFNWLLVAFLSN